MMGELIILHQKPNNLAYVVSVLLDCSVVSLLFRNKMNKPHSEWIYIFELPHVQ